MRPDSDPTDPMTTTRSDHRRWQFWIDRGGTFTDLVAVTPDGELRTHKLLSDNPRRYADAAIQGMRDLLGLPAEAPLPTAHIADVKMGTTVATNALLERRGASCLLLITRGFGDALRIGYQNRPELFALDIQRPRMLYQAVVEIDERVAATGEVIRPLDVAAARAALATQRERGLDSVAICLMHGYRFPEHERCLADLARELGYTHISVSHQVSPLIKLIARGDTTVLDAYLSPVLRRDVDRLADHLHGLADHQLLFMQSNGGLTTAQQFQGKDAIVSGPAGGVVGMVKTAEAAGFKRLIGFDMGGTSTDVSHYAGDYERSFETEVAGVRLRTPMMNIHTVAAGGGSILRFDGARLQVGPASAGADPGPACYRNGGPLTVTDCHVMLGTLQPAHFPAVFGPDGRLPLDADTVKVQFTALAQRIAAATGTRQTAQRVAQGFLAIAVANMANAIKRISVQRGHDLSGYALACFGGAGGQHACAVADALGMKTIVLHPHAGVLSALGIGLADRRLLRECTVAQRLDATGAQILRRQLAALSATVQAALQTQVAAGTPLREQRRALLRYQGSDTALSVDVAAPEAMRRQFETRHRQRFGFDAPDKPLVIESAQVEWIAAGAELPTTVIHSGAAAAGRPIATHSVMMSNGVARTPFFERRSLPSDTPLDGPCVIVETTGTVVVEHGWLARRTARDDLILERRRHQRPQPRPAIATHADPVMLEIFNNAFMAIAEQMGDVLANTAQSVNIKERLDFSCAVFDRRGALVANAPHMPVHLGAMSDSIRSLIARRGGQLRDGDVYALNAPYDGGTHLPDVTLIKPVFAAADGGTPLFYVAARGHHADIGGITPGSMPPHSTTVTQEGVLIDHFLMVDAGVLRERATRALLSAGPYPARNPDANLADFKAQIAACEQGAQALHRLLHQVGAPVVRAYMGHVQDNAEAAVRRVIDRLHAGQFRCELDDGHAIAVRIDVNHEARTARIDFTGTSAQHPGNFNAPVSVCKAAVLYVFRCLVRDAIPLNQGCLTPLEIIIPAGSMINPRYPAAVVAGNVETSQAIVDALLGALGVSAAAQGTMNNLTWGNARYQYYETLCGGAGATATANGADAVHTHMTNSRLTDPEVLEQRFPVRLDHFGIRRHSGGAGRRRGGDGVERRIRFLEPLTVSLLSGRRRVPPYGLAGGDAGKPGDNQLLRASGERHTLAGVCTVDVGPDDVIVIRTPGGGGFGAMGTPRKTP